MVIRVYVRACVRACLRVCVCVCVCDRVRKHVFYTQLLKLTKVMVVASSDCQAGVQSGLVIFSTV